MKPYVMTEDRLRSTVINTARLLRHKYRGVPLWSLVSDMTGHGCTVSQEICITINLDPMQNAGVLNLKDLK